jgi:SAM-dependent methyltransferase
MNPLDFDYFGHINPDLLRWLPDEASQIVEIGCGAGALGAEYKRRCPQVRYVGVEMDADAAAVAAGRLDQVIVGDVERLTDLPVAPGTVDVLLYGDVLEHLVDPWSLLKRQAAWLAPQGIVLACIPNIAHWSVVVHLLVGEWPYLPQGLFDRTHLRFFTLSSIRSLFAGAGLKILDVRSTSNTSPETAAKEQEFIRLFRPLAAQIGIGADAFVQRSMAFQYVIRATVSR